MKVLIIYSNHNTGNFNHQLLDRVVKKFIDKGDEVMVRDLYKMNFDPVLSPGDFEMISAGNTPDDISKEQDLVRWADLLMFIYPVWWGGMPAIMKGYIDRVFSWGFAYKSNGNGPYPLLTDKKAIVMSSLGQSRAEYEQGMFQAMNKVNTEGVFGFCGIEVIHQLYFASIHSITDETRDDYYNEAEKLVEGLFIENIGTKNKTISP